MELLESEGFDRSLLDPSAPIQKFSRVCFELLRASLQLLRASLELLRAYLELVGGSPVHMTFSSRRLLLRRLLHSSVWGVRKIRASKKGPQIVGILLQGHRRTSRASHTISRMA